MLKVFTLAAALAAAAPAGPPMGPAAEAVRRYPAQEATQGVAVDGAHLYAVANSVIAKYDKRTGQKVGEWRGDPARYPHINSCTVIARELVCASSNYPKTPHVSSVEVFDPQTMRHKRTVALGLGTGSVTWVERKDGAWWVAFANYDGNGGEAPRDHRHTVLVRFDDQWRRTEAWAFPASVLARFTPMSSSGGGWGPDGRLYITGHDHPELYVLALPTEGGATLEHLATIPAPIEGQAIDWDDTDKGMLYGINRARREIVAMRMPPIPGAPPPRR